MGRQEFLHPGFPKIGAIEKFRRNVERKVEEGSAEFVSEANKIDTGKYPLKHNDKTAIRMRKQQDGPLQMRAFFDKTTIRSAIGDINDELVEIGTRMITDSLAEAVTNTRHEITYRNFKSKIKPKTKASGDMYEVISDSLRFRKTNRDGNQFASFVAGSFDGSEVTPTGVRGSRMDFGINLIDITEEGTSPFFAHLTKSVFRNPAKRNMK